MNKEDYSKYYIQGSDHYLLPKDIFDELFNEMENWKEESQKQKEVIDKAINFIKNAQYDAELQNHVYGLNFSGVKRLLDILKEVSE